MIGFVYEWTNLVNGKRYIGAHIGQPDDGYIGSGSAFRAAIRKHGLASFQRSILHEEFGSEENVWRAEAEIVDARQAVESRDYYNLRGGGLNGRIGAEAREKMRVAALGRINSPEARAKMSAAHRGRRLSPEVLAGRFGRKHSEATKRAIGAAVAPGMPERIAATWTPERRAAQAERTRQNNLARSLRGDYPRKPTPSTPSLF